MTEYTRHPIHVHSAWMDMVMLEKLKLQIKWQQRKKSMFLS